MKPKKELFLGNTDIDKENALLRIFYILCFFNLQILLLPTITHAYLYSNGEEHDFLRAGYEADRNKNEKTFVLYDNCNSSVIDKNQILFPKSKFFIPLDLISLELPIPIVFYNHTTTENALADLLYANLKLKKLIEEYQNIQTRSKKHIEDLKIAPYLDSQPFFHHRENIHSIYKIDRRLSESSVNTIEDSRIQLNVSMHELAFNRNNSLKTFVDIKNKLRPNSKLAVTQIKSNSDQDQIQDYASYGMDEEDLDNGSTSAKKDEPNSYKEGIDPFVRLTNLVSYLKNNKGEAFFYGIILSLLFIFLSSILQR